MASKVSSQQFDVILEACICLYDALSLITDILDISSNASKAVSEQLSRKLFAPLYSTLFAVNARIFGSLSRILLDLEIQYEKLKQLVKVTIFI